MKHTLDATLSRWRQRLCGLSPNVMDYAWLELLHRYKFHIPIISRLSWSHPSFTPELAPWSIFSFCISRCHVPKHQRLGDLSAKDLLQDPEGTYFVPWSKNVIDCLSIDYFLAYHYVISPYDRLCWELLHLPRQNRSGYRERPNQASEEDWWGCHNFPHGSGTGYLWVCYSETV